MIPKLWSLVGIRLYERYPPEEDSSSSTATSIATYMGMRFPKVSPLISGNYHIETIILGANVGTCPGQLQVDKNNQSGDIPNLGGQFISVDLTYTTHRWNIGYCILIMGKRLSVLVSRHLYQMFLL
ncbi:hypothetical protein V6N13_019726 [Hibiscus sabdariffa]